MAAFTNSQRVAIFRGIELGSELQRDYPMLRELLEKMTFPEIIRHLEIPSAYGVSPIIAKHALTYAKQGHDGSWGIPAYSGLLEKDVSQRLIRQHRLESNLQKGNVLWLSEEYLGGVSEKEFALALSQSEIYQRSNGSVNNVELTRVLNEQRDTFGYPPALKPESVRKLLYKYRKQKEKVIG